MHTGENMNPGPLNTITDYPVTPATPGSDFGTMLMLLQILLQTRKFDLQPEQELQMVPNITWSQGNFTSDGQPNPKESKTTHEEDNDASKIIKKREIGESLTTDEDFLLKRHAGKSFKEYQVQNPDLNLQNVQDEQGNHFMTTCGRITADAEESCNSIDGLDPLPIPHPVDNWQHVTLNDYFGPGAKLVIRGTAPVSAPRLTFDLEYSDIIPLHIDNRWSAAINNRLILNTYHYSWGPEVIYDPAEIHLGSHFVVSIECLEEAFKICINDAFFTEYTHRISPSKISTLSIRNAGKITSIYYRGSN